MTTLKLIHGITVEIKTEGEKLSWRMKTPKVDWTPWTTHPSVIYWIFGYTVGFLRAEEDAA